MIHKKITTIMLAMGLSFVAIAEKDIDFKIGYQGVKGIYSGNTEKKSIDSNGFILNATFLDDITITHTSTETGIVFEDPVNNIDQTSKFTTIGYNIYTDDYGMVNVRGDYQSIDNNDATGATDNVSINSYQASILPYDELYYAEVGYSQSSYPYTGNTTFNTGLKINQLNATYGTGITEKDWLTVKGYHISSSDKARTHDKEKFNSVEVKYKYFLEDNVAKVDNVELSGLFGERVYAVDGAAGSAYNMGDLQTGSIGLTTEWKLSEDTNILFSLSREKYKTSAGNEYTGNYSYINLNYEF